MARQTRPQRPTHGFNKDDSQAAKDRIEREYAGQTVGNGGSGLLIFDRRPAPSADGWCCE